jgi:hypothetical protein
VAREGSGRVDSADEVPEPPNADSGASTADDITVFVTDITLEGERLGAVLRARGYSVVDVPLRQLKDRAASTPPSLLVFAVDAPEASETLHDVLALAGIEKMQLVLLGESEAEVQQIARSLPLEPGGAFARALDVYAILRTVESLVGAPSGLPGGSLMPPSKTSTRPPSSHPSAAPGSGRKRAQAASGPPATRPSTAPPPRDPERPAATPRPAGSQEPGELPPVVESSSPPAAASLYPADSLRPFSDQPGPPFPSDQPSGSGPGFDEADEPSLPPLGAQGLSDASQELPSQIPRAEISPELAQLLQQAEQRVGQAALGSGYPSIEPLAPDDESEAPVPEDVLCSLDEPLAGMEDADDAAAGAGAGTHSGSEGGRTNLGTGTDERSGSGAPASTAAGSKHGEDQNAAALGQTAGSAVSETGVQPAEASSPSEAVTGATPLGPAAEANAAQREPAADPKAPATAPRNAPTSAPPSLSRSQPPGAPPSVSRRSVPTSAPPALGQAAPTPPPPSAGGITATGVADLQPSQLPPGSEGGYRPSTLPPLDGAAQRRGPEPAQVQEAPHAVDFAGSAAGLWDASTPPPPARTDAQPPTHQHAAIPQIPSTLGPRDALSAMARIIRGRYTGALALEDDAGIRRIVFREGDFVTAASSVEGESLVAFLVRRGALPASAAAQLGRKLPPFGRHAGAALIAHGHLRQDELWPVLRAHAEWLVGRAMAMQRGVASLEAEVPARLETEPAVFGGATGAEVFVELIRRVLHPSEALARLGGGDARLRDGPSAALLSEASLPEHDLAFVNRAKTATLQQIMQTAHSPDALAVLFALAELGVLERSAPASAPGPGDGLEPEPVDQLDDEARRARILARKALVDEGDYFALLGVMPNATAYEIRHAFLQLRREFEPHRILTAGTVDLRDQVEDIVEVLEEAYDVLRDGVRRERYRRALEATP